MQDQTALRIAVQDRHRLYRDGLAMVLDAEPDLTAVATAGTAAELVGVVASHKIDVVILELDVADWDACRLVAALRRRKPCLSVVGTTSADRAALSVRAYQAGVRTVFSRSAGIRTLLQMIRAMPQHVVLPAPLRGISRVEESRPLLTPRETQVLGAIGTGATTRAVGAAMGISPKTVDNHKQRIFVKLGVQNQAHAVAVALRRGLLTTADASTALGA